jgi:hypothetical protein
MKSKVSHKDEALRALEEVSSTLAKAQDIEAASLTPLDYAKLTATVTYAQQNVLKIQVLQRARTVKKDTVQQ